MTAIFPAPTVGVDNDFEWLDFFCGAGGSTTGLVAAGAKVKLAANHWPLAIASHAANHPGVDHARDELDLVDFRRYPSTFALWASPVCTWASRARGEHFEIQQMSLLERERHDERERARVGMYDVWRYCEVHRPTVVVVENVKEVYTRSPEHWRCWWAEGEKLGYRLRVLSLNSMVFGVPQSRDRIYVVAVRRGAPWPDLEFRPACWCARCETTVNGVQSWRRLDRPHIGCLGEQYDYRCPNCAQVCWPWVRPAASVIDWTLDGTRIGDRASLGMRPLAAGTLERIRKGLMKFGLRRAVIPTDRNRAADSKLPRTVELPLPTQTGRATLGVVSVPFLVQAAGNTYERPNSTCRSRGLDQPIRTQTGTLSDAVVSYPAGTPVAGSGEPWVCKFYGTSVGHAITDPLAAVTADGNHHALVVAHYAPGWTRRAAVDPLGTVTAVDHHSLLVPPGGTWRHAASPVTWPMPARTTSDTDALVTVPFLVPYYGNGRARLTGQPMNTLGSVDTNALVEAGVNVDVEDCLFRMLEPYESKWAMGLYRDYVILGNKRQQTRQAGNAVTPPVATALAERIREAFS